MGADYYLLDKAHQSRRGALYPAFKKAVCDLLEMPCAFDVTGPGDDQCPSDADIIAELKRRLEGTT